MHDHIAHVLNDLYITWIPYTLSGVCQGVVRCCNLSGGLSGVCQGLVRVLSRGLSGVCQGLVRVLSGGQGVLRGLSGGCQEFVRVLSQGLYCHEMAGFRGFQKMPERGCQGVVTGLSGGWPDGLSGSCQGVPRVCQGLSGVCPGVVRGIARVLSGGCNTKP